MMVEGIDYSREGIEAIRVELIRWRDSSMKQWPDSIGQTLVLTHTIALLARLVELTPPSKKEIKRLTVRAITSLAGKRKGRKC